MSKETKVFIDVDKDGMTGKFQLSISDGVGGYRLAGPKYNGSSRNIIHKELTQNEAAEIRSYLNESFPEPTPPIQR